MKKLILLISLILIINALIANAQCGKRRVTEFYPAKTEYVVDVPIMASYKDGTSMIAGHSKQVKSDITPEWWIVWFCENKPEVLSDYWGCEECSDTTGTGFIVLKKGNTSVILFNLNGIPYAIFDAKPLQYQWDYQKKLNPDEAGIARNSKVKFFQYLQKEFNSKEVTALTTKNLEAYFQ